MRFHRLADTVIITALLADAAQGQSQVRTAVDSARGEIVISVGPIAIAPSTPYAHHGTEQYHVIQWPASGWLRGYQVNVLDSTGRVLPRQLLHHAGMANLDRRQVAAPIAERVFAAAQETTPVVLPMSMGLPLSAGQRMVLYYALVNPDTVAVAGAVLEVRMPWTNAGASGITAIVPFYANARPDTAERISFDVPAGRSETHAEFTVRTDGWLRVAGGHLHDHGVELRIEDAARNKVLARIRATRDADGRVLAVRRTKFPFKRRGLRLRPGHRYRVVAVYDNPTGELIAGGAMGFVAGVFIPKQTTALDSVDATDALFARDVRWLLGGTRSGSASAHSHH